MEWKIIFTGKSRKQINKLPPKVLEALNFLRSDIEADGLTQQSWPNYGKLKGKKGFHHCHLNKGKPRYVAVWCVENNKIKVVEIRYVGTHEKVNYGKIS
ncbi:cytotoxic translational repressor of toxin-antitoxin stability system [Desulfovibrio sp. JC022]|uniref:cytotoxic translational repressor of toxin-antitoxin stability system n=1 Tax=Desulfovibrio sp. JC022 TaxID=2593642 RepID=UPI0013D0C4E7|nr:cytotoxic translational repressor of toxin-antitoxin stability system [Desulfovibrio sp. JC022]NDV22243.1 cytotoxic translational repressor of toxin-antitoxin stability system [Desulfovibrio sp. JC022]